MEQNFRTVKMQYMPINHKILMYATRYVNAFDEIMSAPHIHPQYELIYVEKGKLRFLIEGQKVELEEGDILFLNSFVVHSNEPCERFSSVCLFHFSVEEALPGHETDDRIFTVNMSSKYFKMSHNKNEDECCILGRLITEAAAACADKSTGNDFIIQGILYQILGIFSKIGYLIFENSRPEKASQKAASKVNKVLEYIEEHFDEDITVEKAAELINVNPSYFCRIFKNATGNTFIHYINNYRIMQAKQRLLKPEATITEVMYEIGFSNYSYFNRVFKKYSGCSPTEYKQKYITEREKEE